MAAKGNFQLSSGDARLCMRSAQCHRAAGGALKAT